MKLIDIEDDALVKTVSLGNMSMKALWKRIKSEREVDAIPIKWMERYSEKHLSENRDDESCAFIHCIETFGEPE